MLADYLVGRVGNTEGAGRAGKVGTQGGVGDSMVDSKDGRVGVDMIGNCWVAELLFVALVVVDPL